MYSTDWDTVLSHQNSWGTKNISGIKARWIPGKIGYFCTPGTITSQDHR